MMSALMSEMRATKLYENDTPIVCASCSSFDERSLLSASRKKCQKCQFISDEFV